MLELLLLFKHFQARWMDKNLMLFVFRFNRLAVGSIDERTFAHLANLQVLDIGSGNTDLLFNIDKIEGNTKLEEEEDGKDD